MADLNEMRTWNFDTLLEMIETNTTVSSFPKMKEPLSNTLEAQLETETLIQEVYDDILEKGSDKYPQLKRRDHIFYIHRFLNEALPAGYSKMMTNVPWMGYWLSNGAMSLKSGLMPMEATGLNMRIMECFTYSSAGIGGFAGGRGQLPHIASTYAAVLTLANAYDEEVLEKVDRAAIRKWLKSLKQPDGSFVMHQGGESDCRAVYCALVVAKLLDIWDDELVSGCGEWLLSCQTYEGGFSGEANGEAHGGYTYCAVAALVLVYGIRKLAHGVEGFNTELLISWCVQRQYALEGGLSGRSNKLVDACYSHWVGGVFSILETIVNAQQGNSVDKYRELFNRRKLMAYLICCCQDDSGGMRDKPEMYADFYHTCYSLCGLSACQYIHLLDEEIEECGFEFTTMLIEDAEVIDQTPVNFVSPIDPVFSLPLGFAKRMRRFYKS